MGHVSRLGSSGGTYYSAIIPKLKESYLEFMPHLSLLTPVETRVIESASYKELKAQNEVLKERITVIEARESEKEPFEAIITGLMNDPKMEGKMEGMMEKLMEKKKLEKKAK